MIRTVFGFLASSRFPLKYVAAEEGENPEPSFLEGNNQARNKNQSQPFVTVHVTLKRIS